MGEAFTTGMFIDGFGRFLNLKYISSKLNSQSLARGNTCPGMPEIPLDHGLEYQI